MVTIRCIGVAKDIGRLGHCGSRRDVLKKERENYQYNYDNWSSDIKPGEQWAAYAARSRKETQDYIESYPDNGNGEYIYCLIFTEKPTLEQLQKMNEC